MAGEQVPGFPAADAGGEPETQVTSYEVRFPQRTSFGMGQRKPKADLLVTLDTGAVLELKFPQAAGRALNAEGIPLPLAKDRFFERLEALEQKACTEQLLSALERRDLSRAEAAEKLDRLGFLPQFVEPSVSFACAHRFINDLRYASSFIDRKKRQGWGRRRIERELAHRGVAYEELEGYPEAYFSDEDDLQRARALLARKSVPAAKPYEKLVRFLMGKGFPYGTAAEAVRQRLSEEGERA